VLVRLELGGEACTFGALLSHFCQVIIEFMT
jgi:hypothetical protein